MSALISFVRSDSSWLYLALRHQGEADDRLGVLLMA
jgi:hypothetical protein